MFKLKICVMLIYHYLKKASKNIGVPIKFRG